MADRHPTPLYASRRRRNIVAMALGLRRDGLRPRLAGADPRLLLWKGFSGLSLAVFTEMTPPPGCERRPAQPDRRQPGHDRHRASLIGTPIGILAGTYMAEYGRYDKLTTVVRFINDILLSAPSIVIGLFIYEIMVAPMGHFSGWAGAVALAVIVIPVVVRTTEDMLHLVPDTLREAAASHRPAALADDHAHRLSRGARRHDHRRAAGRRPHQRRDRAAAVHRAQQPVLEHRTSTRRWPACRSSSSSSRSAPTRTGRSWPGPAR